MGKIWKVINFAYMKMNVQDFYQIKVNQLGAGSACFEIFQFERFGNYNS